MAAGYCLHDTFNNGVASWLAFVMLAADEIGDWLQRSAAGFTARRAAASGSLMHAS